MDNCTQESCIMPSEYICSCKSLSFCKTHILEHVTQSKTGTHNFEGLFEPITAENLTIYSNHLVLILNHLNNIVQETEKKLNTFIQSALKSLNLVRTKMNELSKVLINKIKNIHDSGKINKKTTNKLELALIQSSKELESFLNSATLPTIKFNLPETSPFTLTCEEIQYQSEYPLFDSIVSRLTSINNKVILNEYSKSLNNKSSQEVLLSLMQLSSYQPQYEPLASKAFSILSKHHYNFSNLSFSKINLSNSEITGGKFTGTSFTGCNFSQIKLNIPVLLPASMDFFTYKTMQEGSKCFNRHKDKIQCMKFSLDSRILVSGSLDRCICVWEVRTGHCLNILEGHADDILCLDIADDNSEILSGGKDGLVKLWDLVTGICICNFTLEFGRSVAAIRSVVMSSNKRWIVAGTLSQNIIVWNKNGTVNIMLEFDSDIWSVTLNSFLDAEGNQEIAAGCRNGDLIILKTNSKKPIWTQKQAHKQWISCVMISVKGKSVITTGCDGYIRVWKKITQKTIFNLQAFFQKPKELKLFDSGIFSASLFGHTKFIFLICENVVQIINRKKLAVLYSSKLNFPSFISSVSTMGTYFSIAQENSIMSYQFPEIFSQIPKN